MRRILVAAGLVLLFASACSADDPVTGRAPDPSLTTFDRILAGERSLIPDPNNPEFDDNPCFGLDGTDPLQALECPFLEIDLDRDRAVLELPSDPAPDLVISAHQAAVIDDDNVVHVVTLRNIGDGDAEFPTSGELAILQFHVSLNPFVDTADPDSWEAAGGTTIDEGNLGVSVLAPGEEVEYVFPAGSGVPDRFDYPDFFFDIASLTAPEVTDANPANNVSVTPLIPAP